MDIVLGTAMDRNKISEKFPHTKQVLGDGGILIVAKEKGELIGFLWAFVRDIPVAVNEREIFIHVVEVFDAQYRCNGIGSLMVRKCIEVGRAESCYQVRAYCDGNNIPSNMLWIKNSFTISPVKMQNGTIPGSYVTYKL